MKRIATFIRGIFCKISYKPEDIPATIAKEKVPKKFHLKGVPWLSYEKAYCESACLQMVARSFGVEDDINYFNFLMGFTYDFNYLRPAKLAIPFSDPTPGLRFAAPLLGLRMRYMVTSDRRAFLEALKYYLYQDRPVRVQVNVDKLYDREGFGPHGILVVGFDEHTFFFYETGGKDRRAGRGRKGISIPAEKLAEAVLDLSKNFEYPWKYALTIFEKAEEKKDLSGAFERNGKMLIGGGFCFAFGGAHAIKAFAKDLEKILSAWGKELIRVILEPAVYNRMDNAEFLKKRFPNIGGAVKAASHLEKASRLYDETLREVKSPSFGKENVGKVRERLNRIAELERKAGEALLGAAKEYTSFISRHGCFS